MADRIDPYRASRYLLEIDGTTRAGFSECTIPDSTQDPIEYREGNEVFTVRKIPGLNKYGNLTLTMWHDRFIESNQYATTFTSCKPLKLE